MRNKRRGFTLIELIVVLVIISILALVGSVSWVSSQTRAKNLATREDVSAVARVIMKYKADMGAYPSSTAQLQNDYKVRLTNKASFKTNGVSVNLVYCTTSSYADYAVAAISNGGALYYIRGNDDPVEYTGGINWLSATANTICSSIDSGLASAGSAGYQNNAWQSWLGS